MKTLTKGLGPLQEGVIRDFAQTLLDNGFRLLIYQPRENQPVTWLIFELDGKLGYCQVDRWNSGLRFSTVHKPSKEAGTGFGLQDEWEGVEPTIERAKEAFISTPHWFHDSYHNPKGYTPVKYKSLEEYMSRETILKYELISK